MSVAENCLRISVLNRFTKSCKTPLGMDPDTRNLRGYLPEFQGGGMAPLSLM